jgi:C4-type Zn-finger protein
MITTMMKVAGVITELTRMAMGSLFPFTIVVSDPAGNSFVQVTHIQQ